MHVWLHNIIGKKPIIFFSFLTFDKIYTKHCPPIACCRRLTAQLPPPPIRARARLVSIIYLSYFFRQITEGKVPWTGLVLARFSGTRLIYLSYLFVKPRREKFREGRFQTKSADFREHVWTRILCVLTRFIQVNAVAGDVNLQSIWRKTHFVVTVIVIVFLIIVFLFFFVATFSEFVLKKAKKEISLKKITF